MIGRKILAVIEALYYSVCFASFVLQKRGFEFMHRVATSCEALASHLLRAAQFNIGRAYYQGAGVRLSLSEAERLLVHFNTNYPVHSDDVRLFLRPRRKPYFCR